jgi:hypothetical protein
MNAGIQIISADTSYAANTQWKKQKDSIWSSYTNKFDTKEKIQNRRISKFQNNFQNEKKTRNFSFTKDDSYPFIGGNSLLGKIRDADSIMTLQRHMYIYINL